MEEHSMLMDWGFIIVKILPKLINRLSATPTKIPAVFYRN